MDKEDIEVYLEGRKPMRREDDGLMRKIAMSFTHEIYLYK